MQWVALSGTDKLDTMVIGNQDGTRWSNEATVFLSYSRDDQKRALPIIKLLEDAGFSVWWDGLIEGGERFSRTTEDALEHAKAIVVLVVDNIQ